MHRTQTLKTSTLKTLLVGLAAGTAWLTSFAPGHAVATVIDFETPVIAAPNAELSGESFAAQGVHFRTVRLTGTVAIGGTITLADQNTDLRLYRDASAISGEQLAGPALGGTANDLLMSFDQALAKISLISDDTVETANPIRLIALAATTTAGRYRVIDFIEAQDDAVSAPANLLALAPSESFTLALFEVRTQQEAFDDLTFTLAASGPVIVDPPPVVLPPDAPPVIGATPVPEPASYMLLASAIGATAAARRSARVAARRG